MVCLARKVNILCHVATKIPLALHVMIARLAHTRVSSSRHQLNVKFAKQENGQMPALQVASYAYPGLTRQPLEHRSKNVRSVHILKVLVRQSVPNALQGAQP